MVRGVRIILQTTVILFSFGITAKAQPVLVKEISNQGGGFIKIDDIVFFFSWDSLFRTDGTADGTIFLKNGFVGSSSLKYKEYKGSFYFLEGLDDKLWRSDGTPSGTILLKESSKEDMTIVAATDEFLYFTASSPETGYELYKTNGTVAGTVLVKDINPGQADGFVGSGASVGNVVLFSADNGSQGRELWKTNGTLAGTSIVKDINPGAGNGFGHDNWFYRSVYSHNGKFYFTGYRPETGGEPWVSDGTPAGTVLLKDILPGEDNMANIQFQIDLNDEIYFLTNGGASTPEEAELWKTGGSPSLTTKLKNVGRDVSMSNYFRLYKEEVYFFTKPGGTEAHLWSTDGTGAGTNSFFSFPSDSSTVYLSFLDVVNDHLLFTGASVDFETPFYRTDGTTGGTQAFAEFKSTKHGDAPKDITKVGEYVFYADHDGLTDTDGYPSSFEDYFHLFRADGFSAESMRTLYGINTVFTEEIVDFNGQVLFTTFDQRFHSKDKQKRLWTLDPDSPPRRNPSVTLVDAGTDEDVRRLIEGSSFRIPDGVTINLRYNPLEPPGSVVFKLNDVIVRTETGAPYSLAGEIEGDYAPWEDANPGIYKLTATPYSEAGGNGTPGTPLDITFTIEGEDGGENCAGAGKIIREVWSGIPGKEVSSIPVNSPPTSTSELTIFEGPFRAADNYGARIRGYVCVPETGNYTFWIASDDRSELWLSTDDNPANKVKIASVGGATSKRQWDKYTSQKSVPIPLTAGRKYYIEALHKESVSYDHVAVGWQLPNGTMERPIPGNRLIPYQSVPLVDITSPEDGRDFVAPATVNIAADASSEGGSIAKVEFYNGTTKLGEDATSPYAFTWNNVSAGDYTLIAKATNTAGISGTDSVDITVTPSCAGTGTIIREVWNGIPGKEVSLIPVNSPPSSTSVLTLFEGPFRAADNYGARIRGYICVPATGNYTFWIASDDRSELWLSTSDNPASKVRIAYVGGATSSRQWDKYTSQRSIPIHLTAGQRYYVEALHKESVTYDHVAVGWQLPNGTMERPIPGNRLMRFESATTNSFLAANATASQSDSLTASADDSRMGINIYPNPAPSGVAGLTIARYGGIQEVMDTKIEIVSMTGEVVFTDEILCEGNCDTDEMKINKELVSGIYLVNVVTNGRRFSERLLVK